MDLVSIGSVQSSEGAIFYEAAQAGPVCEGVADIPVNETLVRDLAGGEFLEHQRNVVLIGGTGTGKSHLAVGIARNCARSGKRDRFFNVVDLVNKLDAEARADRSTMQEPLIRAQWSTSHGRSALPARLVRHRSRTHDDAMAHSSTNSATCRSPGQAVSSSSASSAACMNASRSSSPPISRSGNADDAVRRVEAEIARMQGEIAMKAEIDMDMATMRAEQERDAAIARAEESLAAAKAEMDAARGEDESEDP